MTTGIGLLNRRYKSEGSSISPVRKRIGARIETIKL